jgi:4-hydroxy-3-methylbut-2-enyl diphosphate reductase
MGMCFGVKDALEKVMALERPQEVTIYGQLVHNPEVLKGLRAKGFSGADERDRSNERTANNVVITAHGISDKERQGLLAAGRSLIDTTCPLVRRVHETAKHFEKCGYFVVVVGKRDHVEVRGLTGDLANYDVVESPDDVRIYKTDRIGLIAQTTTPPSLFEAVYDKVVRKNFGKEIRAIDTICRPTRERQEALEDLLDQVEALVVVGGRNSNNTRQLALRAEVHGLPCFTVETAAELKKEWFEGLGTVGLTAGTSTLDRTIEEVHGSLISMEVSDDKAIRK